MEELHKFVHLHVHSYYSILDGQASVKGIVDKAIADGMPAVALTDHGAMFGIKEFYNYINSKNAGTGSEIKAKHKELQELEKEAEGGGLTPEKEEQANSLRNEIVGLKKKLFKPILGCEAYCARRSRFSQSSTDPDPLRPTRKIDASGWHIILLAKNKQGYQNLIKMVSRSWTEGFYHKPRIDKELLEQYHEGIMVSTACLGGEIPQRILNNDIEGAEESIKWFKSVFGEDFYIELQRHKASNPTGNQETYEYQQRANAVLIELARKHDVKIIATNDSHFLNREDAEAHERLICLSTGQFLNPQDQGQASMGLGGDAKPKRKMLYSKEEWFKTTSEMNAVFADIPEALTNTLEIADKVEFYSIDNPPLMPDFPIPEGFADAKEYLEYLTYEGAKKRYAEITDEIRERIDFELKTVNDMGFPGYFLIVQDFIAAARDMGVLVGPGRGSAAGSAVAYCLGITNLDPIKYDLLFERFLNPDRISMPDVDIDFDDDGRYEVLKWVTDKYGHDCVAHIITFGTMATKGALKDVARVQGLPLAESNRLTKLIPAKLPNVKKPKLKDFIEHVQELKEASLSKNKTLVETLKYAGQLEGTVRNTGVHACGIIIGKMPIDEVVPVSTAKDSVTGEKVLTTQYEGKVIEETGLIKMDFLGLKTLSIIKEALGNIKERHNIDIDIEAIPLDDEKTFELYQAGATIGTFQFESPGMRKYLRQLAPTCLDDLIAMNALYRPGPMAYIPDFIARKAGEKAIEYDIPCMERYLKDTYGITVYQEQVMLLSRELAGFTRGESDNLRKAMGKKLADKMAVLKVKFIKGGVANGHKEEVLNKIWSDWEAFAEYAFNKSHSTCYSWVAYQTAYLKAHYPSEFMAGNMSRNLGNITEITKLMSECKNMGIKVLVPDVNESLYKFSVNKNDDIRFGMAGVKGVSGKAVEDIIQERKANGLFKDVYDFFERVNLKSCNKKTLEALVYSGAFDGFGIEREAYMMVNQGAQGYNFLAELVSYGQSVQDEKKSDGGGMSLFADDDAMAIVKPRPPFVDLSDISELLRLEAEKDVNGLYLSGNPLDEFDIILNYYCNTKCLEIEQNLQEIPCGKHVIFAGLLTSASENISKKGNTYGRFTIEDFSGEADLALFGSKYDKLKHFLEKGKRVIIHGQIVEKRFKQKGRENEALELDIQRVDQLEEVHDKLISEIEMIMPLEALTEKFIDELSELLENNIGTARFNIGVKHPTEAYVVPYAYRLNKVAPSRELVNFVLENKTDVPPVFTETDEEGTPIESEEVEENSDWAITMK